MKIDRKNGLKAINGGLFLGGGGGGTVQGGLEVLESSLKHGNIELYSIEEFNDDDYILTASLVGSPASKEKYVGEDHYKTVYELFKFNYDKNIFGVITNEMGAQSITNGWMISAATKIPLIDAPCNGRAHPTGTMGSMGLSKVENYETIQTAVGGKGDKEIQIVVKGNLKQTSLAVRNAASLAGGFVTVLRNPVTAAYIKKNAAVNSIKQAIRIGEIFIENKGKLDIILKELSDYLNSIVVCEGFIENYSLKTQNGFDIGDIGINSNGDIYDVVFWNEYMTIENNGVRIATFPDLIAIIDKKTCLPLTSADIKEQAEVVLVKVPMDKLILGGGMFDKNLFIESEKVIDKKIVEYVF